ncbi:hypothetical protein HU200_059118 [Digitaria exilis]|uniref:Uncharacterized protein n=1 Tax=Digitaria exilis TaxID=1010633 RepID=A0A835AES0_9POAL|nr:hypothetical protein HU200_059118 [Digitaria exilis]
MQYLLPAEKSKVTEEDRLPMCEGMKIVLGRYGFDMQPEIKISGIHVEDWDLFKLATALMIVAYPNGEQVLFGNDYPTLLKDAPKYKDKLREVACFRVYRDMLRARKIRHKALKQLVLLTRLAREDYEAQRSVSDPKITLPRQ